MIKEGEKKENLRKHERRKVFPSFLSFLRCIERGEKEFSPRIRSFTWIAIQTDSFAASPFKREFCPKILSFDQKEGKNYRELCIYRSNTYINWYNARKEILQRHLLLSRFYNPLIKLRRISMDQRVKITTI